MTDVRVRIAPSPTGDLHVGTAYIALFNYCFAKTQGGKFILRIEDTDQTRSRRQYEDRIHEGLRWLDLQYDEGPDIGGPHGPYRQSERSEIYREHAAKLVEAGRAYPCFCTPEQLNDLRKQQRANKEMEGYRGQLRPSRDEEIARVKAGEPHVIRLEMPADGVCHIADEVFKDVEYEYAQMDHQVLLKSDGLPTYHLANVVDDHLMGITHVIRGQDWLPSTPKHLYLYECFGWTPPKWVHVPLLLNPDRTKMSKRKNATSVFYYRDAGFLPEALLNYMALIGYSRPGAGEGDELFTLDEMLADFDIANLHSGGAVFDMRKLAWLSGRWIREKQTPAELLERVKRWRFNDATLAPVLEIMQPRMDTLGDFMDKCAFFWQRETPLDVDLLVPKGREASEVAAALQCLLWEFEDKDDWSPSGAEAAIKEVAAFLDWKLRDVTGPLFVVLSGQKVAPPLFETMSILGKDLCRARVMAAIQALGAPGKKKLKKLEESYKRRERTQE